MNKPLHARNIYLIGMMGSGKTTVGQVLAEKLEYRFFDTDELIEKFAQKTIPDIFSTEGEERFRDLESHILRQLSTDTGSAVTEHGPAAIATGGGIVQRAANWKYLRYGLTIWLDADITVLNQRLTEDTSRPLARQLESLLEARRPLYTQADFNIAIQPKQTPEDIATQIVSLLPSHIRDETPIREGSKSHGTYYR